MINDALAVFPEEHDNYFSPEHPVQEYLYREYVGNENVVLTMIPMSKLYNMYARELWENNNDDEALEVLEESLKWNPVNIDTMFFMSEIYKHTGRLEELITLSSKVYPLCCTKCDIARFYRLLGFYYLEKYKPEQAAALYTYSNTFYKTKQADSELEFLAKALKIEKFTFTYNNIQKILNEIVVPLEISTKTTYILKEAADDLNDKENYQAASDCLAMLNN